MGRALNLAQGKPKLNPWHPIWSLVTCQQFPIVGRGVIPPLALQGMFQKQTKNKISTHS